MRKLLGVILVLALVAATAPAAKADILKNVRTSGEVQVLGMMYNDTAAGGANFSNTSVRVLYGVNAGLAENVKANFTLAYYNLWGQDTAPGGVPVYTSHTGSSLQAYLDNVNVVEANVVLQNLFCCLEAKIGRQFYGDEDSAVMYFGPNHYNALQRDSKQAQSLDGVKLSYVGDAMSWDFIYAKVQEMVGPFPAIDGNNDSSLLGTDAKYAFNENVKVQAYFYQFRNFLSSGLVPGFPPAPLGAADFYMGIYGVKPSFAFEKGNVSVEYARNAGGTRPFGTADQGDMWKVDASLDLGAITPRAQFFRGNNIQTFGNYRPGIIVGQITDNFGTFGWIPVFANSAIFNLGVDMKFAGLDKFTFSVDGFDFRDRNLHGNPKHEADVWVKYQVNKAVELHVAGGFYSDEISDIYQVQSGMLIRF